MRITTPHRAALPLLPIAALMASVLPLAAKPLDAEACARIKFERDALEAAGARSALGDKPQARPMKTLDERSQKLSKLIQLDGQLRFRCGQDLPISSLKPELLVDVPDTVDGEAVVKPVPRKPAPKKAKAASAAPDDQEKAADTALPAPKRTKAAASKAEKTADPPAATGSEAPAAKVRPKAKAKVDDAYRPAAKPEGGDPQ